MFLTRKTRKIAQTVGQNSLWILSMQVMWVILFSNLLSPHQGQELTFLSYHLNQLESIINSEAKAIIGLERNQSGILL